MPLMTNPLAHFEMLSDSIKISIETLDLERHKLNAKIEVLNDWRYKIDSALDAEREKVKASNAASNASQPEQK